MKAIRKILAVVVGLMAAFIAFTFVSPFTPSGRHSELLMIIYVILCVAVPLIVFYFTARLIGWRVDILDMLQHLPRWLLVIIVILYILTWVFGVPAVQTANNAEAVDSYKQGMKHGYPQHWEVYPLIRTSAAFPLLPGLVVSYHEYQVAGRAGWGGWDVHIWYIVGVKEIGRFTIWIS